MMADLVRVGLPPFPARPAAAACRPASGRRQGADLQEVAAGQAVAELLRVSFNIQHLNAPQGRNAVASSESTAVGP